MTEEEMLADLEWLDNAIESLDHRVVMARMQYEKLQKQFNNFSNERNGLMIRLMEFRHGESICTKTQS